MSSRSPDSSDGAISVGPIELVVLQGTPFCNLNCSYCYLSEASRKTKAWLPLHVLETVFTKILSSQYLGRSLHVSWHSGEPLVLKPSYYKSAVDAILRLKQLHAPPGFEIYFDIQTNGTLVNQAWCDFLKAYEHVLSIGISCDGPALLHDSHRRDWAGNPTHQLTEAGMQLLQANRLRFDVIAVVSEIGLDHPEALLEFFAPYSHHIREFHFNLHDQFCLHTDDTTRRDALAKKYDAFLKALLDRLNKADHRPDALPRVRNFSTFYNRILSTSELKPDYDSRSMSRPFKTLNIDTSGDLSTFYAGLTAEDYKDLYGDSRGLVVGNLVTQELHEIAAGDKLNRIANDFECSHRACEQGCDYYSDHRSRGRQVGVFTRSERHSA